jgi:hypothetical protein
VVRPEGELDRIVLSTKDVRLSKNALSGKVTGNLALETMFPFLKARLSGDVGSSRERGAQQEEGDTIELRPIRTPQRQLVQLALHYSINLPHRTLSVTGADWSAADGIDPTLSPRPLVFVDLPAGRPVIPVAVELPAGKVVLLYERLAELTSQRVRHLPPAYPSDSNPADTRKYWDWYARNYSAHTAMKVLEDGIGEGGAPRWVDYRVPVADGRSLNLSLRGQGAYDTGVYAWSTIWRGHEHGLRLVGTLKSGLALNVLAVFEK